MDRKVRSHRFNGVKYLIDVDDPCGGLCDNPDRRKRKHPELVLPDGLPYGDSKGARQGLIWLVHEALHAANWSLHESTVVRMSNELGKLLWRLGYRRCR